MSDLRQKVSRFAEQVADEQGVELFDIELLGKGRLLVRTIIDKKDGITLDDCERFSKSFAAVLDVEELINGPYTLEVSSPGIDRPLRNIDDFIKNKGKLVRIVTKEKIADQKFFIGRIIEISGSSIRVLVNDHEIVIAFDEISKARLEIEL
jgi:ribosome maturation factor RimP